MVTQTSNSNIEITFQFPKAASDMKLDSLNWRHLDWYIEQNGKPIYPITNRSIKLTDSDEKNIYQMIVPVSPQGIGGKQTIIHYKVWNWLTKEGDKPLVDLAISPNSSAKIFVDLR